MNARSTPSLILFAATAALMLFAPPAALARTKQKAHPHKVTRHGSPKPAKRVRNAARKVKSAPKPTRLEPEPVDTSGVEGQVAFDVVRVRRRDGRTGEVLSTTTRFETPPR